MIQRGGELGRHSAQRYRNRDPAGADRRMAGAGVYRIPSFSLHIIRSTMGDYILDETDPPPGTASLMIGHEIPGDRKSDLDRISQTSKRWYFQAQRIPEKTRAMEKWCDALLDAFFGAGGIYPD
jgi:hypothetical protein